MKWFAAFVIVLFSLTFTVVYSSNTDTREKTAACKAAGGYPLITRGVFRDCLVGVKSIEVKP